MTLGLGAARRTILLIDGDPHARATLRNTLEAADFSVGEAANAREGERTILRVRFDAILADLMLETIDAGSRLAQRLHAIGSKIPFYIVSNASDALIGSVALRELGIGGVFLKPVDPAIVIQTLRTRLEPA